MEEGAQTGDTLPPSGALERIARGLALAGGLLSLATACVVMISVLLRWVRIGSVPGDFELVQTSTAIAVFCFLPLCQLKRGNIMVDTFTSRLPARINARIDAFWDFIYAVMMLILAVSLMQGARDAIRSGSNSMVLALPLWPAIAISSLLAFVLSLAAIVTARRLLGRTP